MFITISTLPTQPLLTVKMTISNECPAMDELENAFLQVSELDDPMLLEVDLTALDASTCLPVLKDIFSAMEKHDYPAVERCDVRINDNHRVFVGMAMGVINMVCSHADRLFIIPAS
jgi:hypothetical protein